MAQRATMLPNKELKLTKPSVLELRSLTPVLGGLSQWGTSMAPGNRLKPYNSGAVIPLLKDDLFRASWFPISLGVHQVKIIGGPDGVIEYGEYLIRGGASHFNHSTFKLDGPDAVLLLQALDALRKLPVPAIDDDDLEPERRVITIWADGERQSYSMAARGRRRSLSIGSGYQGVFDQAWLAVVTPVSSRRRSDFGDDGAA
jgi:hypothetical protein